MSELKADMFYDSVSEFYDDMTTFRDRFIKEQEILKRLVSQYSLKNVLDAACGTGLHSIALSKLGVSVTGIDLSPKMIEQAKKNAHAMQATVDFQVLPLNDAHTLESNKYDGILFLGNSLPHILNKDELFQMLNSFASVLKANGSLIIQLLNYTRILTEKKRIVSVKKHGSALYIRFYDFLDNNVRFNLMTVEQDDYPVRHSLYSTLLKPYQVEEITESLDSCGFRKIKLYGSMNFQPFDPQTSGNVIIEAKIN